MPRNFYSGTDAQLATGAANVVAIVTPVPATYGLSAALVTSYTSLSTSYSALLATATTPATRTPVAIANKNAARKLLKSGSLNLSRIVIATPTVTNAQLLALGMNERLIPMPRPVPAAAPIVEIVSVVGRIARARVHDATSERRGLPMGAIGVNVYSFVGPEAPTDPRQYAFEGFTTRAVADVLFPNTVPSGATVWLSACWVGTRGHTSIASVPISFTLQGGAIPAAAA